MKNINAQETLTYLSEKLSSVKKVYYSRFGDGDFEIIRGKREMMHKYSPELSDELKESFAIVDDDYIKGTMFNEPTYNGSRLVYHNPNDFNHILETIKNNFDDYESFTLYSHVLFTYIVMHDQESFFAYEN